MQIIVPMSGFGERFRRAGYSVPKPLIEVDGKPVIAHVIDLFPGETDFLFICNEDHLAAPEYRMAEILKAHCPTGRIVAIPPHRLGPVHAVLQAAEEIDPDAPAIVNYCDFTCYWDYADFKRFVAETECDGAIPAYRGFHPHSLGSTFYAYIRERGLWAYDIREKHPFTDDPLNEFASSGTYYFRSGRLMLDAFAAQRDRNLTVGGEFYASLACKPLFEAGRAIAVYALQHFMQWGTPGDLEEYVHWSNVFRRLAEPPAPRARHEGAVLIPAAGLGSRFAREGYGLPKPLIGVSGRPMLKQALAALPDAPRTRIVLRRDAPGAETLEEALQAHMPEAELLWIDRVT
ncbi:MAG: NTP transferase domain-containing protein, partial [Alphaproteobacteria bacterium]